MDRGIYSASSGGLVSQKRIDVVANNLANVGTVGYKAERIVSRQQAFEDTLASSLPQAQNRRGDFDRTPGVVMVQTTTDFTPGPINHTSDPLNVALRKKNQFFSVQTNEGPMWTRAGNFTRNAEGTLVTADGFPVNGEGGPIALPPGDARIAPNGAIVVNGVVAGRLQVVEFNDRDLQQLRRANGARFQGGTPQTVEADVVPQSLEMANVETVHAMVDMISTQKAFEAYTKTVRTIDELNERALRTARISG